MKKEAKYFPLKLIILFLIFIISLFLSLFLGAQKLTFSQIFLRGTFSNLIFFNIRLPRTILALISGLLLAGAGSVFQMFFRNPLAEPGIMGISAGATLGATCGAFATTFFAAETFFGGLLSPVNTGAFLGAIIAGVLVTLISGIKSGTHSTVSLLLCGTALGSLYSALTSIIIYSDDSKLRSLYIWMLGSFNGCGWNEVMFVLLPAIISLVLFFIASRPLDLLSGGEITALSLGVEIKYLRILVIAAGSIATSAAVCAGGTIGFVGLIAPHVVRKIFGAKSKTLIPLSMITGATILLLADTICRTVVAPAELPVGTITALIGAPFFISLLFSKKGGRNV